MIDPMLLVFSFAGGILGAALGGVNIFIMCGLAIVVGTGINMATGSQTFLNLVAWGPLLGPYASFAGGVAAAAYAARRGKLDNGRNIGVSLMGLDSPDVLFVGGLFGSFGFLLKTFLDMVPNIGNLPWTNTIALSIIINNIIVRLIFGKTGIFGHVKNESKRWQPLESEAWLPWQSQPMQLILLSTAVALPVSFIVTQQPVLLGLGFGLATISLIFPQTGAKAPVFFHIALASETAAVISNNIWWGLSFGILAAFLAEIYSCIFLAHGDSHIDPPSCTLATIFTLEAVSFTAGRLGVSGIAPLAIAVLISVSGYILLSFLRRDNLSYEMAE